jgi:hypothetical protein
MLNRTNSLLGVGWVPKTSANSDEGESPLALISANSPARAAEPDEENCPPDFIDFNAELRCRYFDANGF